MQPTHLYNYLTVARERVFSATDGVPDADYRREHGVGLGSLARTLHHVQAAEWAYVERIGGSTQPLDPTRPEHNPEITTAEAMGFEALRAAWRDQADRTRSTLEGVTDWAKPIVRCTAWQGRAYRYSASADDFFAQLVMHEVHHRAQALLMLRRLGVEVGDVDYNELMWPALEPA